MLSWMRGPGLLSERWDAPCIVTTSVASSSPCFQVPADCRHLHQLANSVLVLDEAQPRRLHLLDATLRTVKLLCTQYGCTVVFSTATQPSLPPAAAGSPGNCRIRPHYFAATRRVTVDWRLKSRYPWWGLLGSGTGKSGLSLSTLGPTPGPPVPAAGGANGGGEYIFPDHGPLSGPPAGSAREIRENGRTSPAAWCLPNASRPVWIWIFQWYSGRWRRWMPSSRRRAGATEMGTVPPDG